MVHLINISVNVSDETSVSSFADDTRLLRGIKTEDDCALQEDLNRVYSWATDAGMVFNAGKFEVLRFWTNSEDAPPNNYTAFVIWELKLAMT